MGAPTATRTDQRSQQDALDELKWNAHVQPNEIGVVITDGVITLTGWVDSYAKRIAAEEAAHRVRDVKAVADDIEVRFPGTSQRRDVDIAAAAARALEWEVGLPVDRVKVTVTHGWVRLEREVEWQFQ